MSDTAGTYLVIAKRKFVPFFSDDDEVIPSNLGALKLGLMSLQFEDKNDPDRAALFMGPNFPERTGKIAGAFDLLEMERSEEQISEVPGFAVNNFGAGGIAHVR